ncbi:caspase domain-containing protein [Streptomyces sp. NPDC085612]|uniref:caspase domain-containing protein n=1 Tax=Streptomyces sp. NPDC085612 TaxID=3365732 RepID=UPI0037D6FD55
MPDPKISRAVLIGTHTYHVHGERQLENLPAVKNNLSALAAVLTDPTLWGLERGSCIQIEQPEHEDQFVLPVRLAAQEAEDTLLVYYSGHGFGDPNSDELFLGKPHTRKGDLFTSFRYEWLRRELQQVPARRKIVVLDCCFAGRALGRRMSGETDIPAVTYIEGSCVLVSSAGDRTSLSPKNERLTAFTGELVHFLNEGVTGGPQLMDINTLYQQVRISMERKSRPVPHIDSANLASSICLARNRKYRPPAAPTTVTAPTVPAGRRETMAEDLALIGELTKLMGSQWHEYKDQLISVTTSGKSQVAAALFSRQGPSDEELLAACVLLESSYAEYSAVLQKPIKIFFGRPTYAERKASKQASMLISLTLAALYRHGADRPLWEKWCRVARDDFYKFHEDLSEEPEKSERQYSASAAFGGWGPSDEDRQRHAVYLVSVVELFERFHARISHRPE